ncbi:MAG: phosphoenolpyruvate--protein phosphotransferase [Clostridia bacterium]|nr:phosphoenolpyruvate--protein phosphotransferase [Clostridia bacterium]
MKSYHGKSVYGGIAIGKIRFWKKSDADIACYRVKNPDEEFIRFEKALSEAKNQIDNLKEKALNEVGEENAEIFEIHKLMLEDKDYIESVENIICNQGINAEYAVSATAETFAAMFSGMDDHYMQARAVDVRDISDRIVDILSKKSESIVSYNEPVIIVAEDLTPSEALQLDKSKILAFVTFKGSLNSHTAILARTMNIPAIIGVDLISNEDIDGNLAVVDGFSGTIYIEPDEEFLKKSYQCLKEELEKKELLETLKGKENTTLDGKKIELFANIGNIKDVSLVIENDANGIGLFRSEFIFLEKNTFPSEEEQFAIYKNAVETMAGKKVIIRTLDIGADKKVDYFKLEQEENPALGLRAIRLCIKRPEIFKTQLRALLRASFYGNLSIMFPMITSLKEVCDVKRMVYQTAAELESQNINYKIPEMGIMIETPAAVMISDELAKEVDFFSIGTNDLSQYSMAIDRQNEELDEFFDPYHKAIIRMIDITTQNAHKAGIWVGICGELAADTDLTQTFLSIGVDELSVSPSRLLPVRKKIREIDLRKK